MNTVNADVTINLVLCMVHNGVTSQNDNCSWVTDRQYGLNSTYHDHSRFYHPVLFGTPSYQMNRSTKIENILSNASEVDLRP